MVEEYHSSSSRSSSFQMSRVEARLTKEEEDEDVLVVVGGRLEGWASQPKQAFAGFTKNASNTDNASLRTNIFCKGSVDTAIPGVVTMVQNKGRNVKKSPSQVDTSPESTPNEIRSTLESLPRKAVLLSGS
ncbi:hypothetical protein Taro_054642 [Colocasia esculenta]|uniref:Uncharacterized protein n=1 Tax=Colocasia esculenta TaxID=4460 RepID=A0A843XPE4_COLES|nr:hypothetical protein [Colocasia esculenta]